MDHDERRVRELAAKPNSAIAHIQPGSIDSRHTISNAHYNSTRGRVRCQGIWKWSSAIVLLVHLVVQVQGCGLGWKEINQSLLGRVGRLQLALEARGPEWPMSTTGMKAMRWLSLTMRSLQLSRGSSRTLILPHSYLGCNPLKWTLRTT